MEELGEVYKKQALDNKLPSGSVGYSGGQGGMVHFLRLSTSRHKPELTMIVIIENDSRHPQFCRAGTLSLSFFAVSSHTCTRSSFEFQDLLVINLSLY